MAKNEENYNNSVLGYLDSIENDKLDRIAFAVTQFVKAYNRQILDEQRASSKKQTETIKVLKESEKNRKADAVKTAKNSDLQTKTLEKVLENSLDAKNVQETLKKVQESSIASMKETNQEIIKGLSELSSLSSENVSYAEKLNSMTAEMQKDNAQARLQDMLKDTKRFRLESKYWKDLTGGIKGMAADFHDFKNNPSRWMSEAIGDSLGHALDKTIDGLKETFSAGLKSITQGLNGLKNSIFDMLADQKKQAEGLAQEFNRSYLETSGALNKSNMAVSSLAQRGELDISRTSKNVEVITSKLLRRFGDELKNMSQDEYERNFKSYAQLINAGAADKIDEIEEIAGGNVELMDKMIKAETQLAGIRSRNDLRIQKGMESAIITAEEAHKLGITYEQSIKANEKNQLFVAKVLASNKEMGVEETKAFTALQKTLMSQDFVTNVLDDKNVNLSQLIGVDSNTAKRILTSGSDKERLDFMNRIIKNGAYNDIPALKKMMEDLGFDPMTLNVLSKQGGLKIDDASIKKITDAQNIDFQNFNDVLLSSGSKINEEIKARISLLSSEGLRDEKGNLNDVGKQQVEALKEFNTMEKLIREGTISRNKEDLNRAKELYVMMQEYSKGNTAAIAELSKDERKLAEDIFVASEKSDKLVKDQLQVSQTLSEAQDLGLDKALSGGGLQGLFSGLLDAGLKSAYSPEYQDKLSSFMDNIKKSIEPAVNVFKELLIDPILDTLHDVIGGILGDIYVTIQKIKAKITDSTYSAEQENYDRLRFTSTKERVLKDVEKISSGRKVGSDDYSSMIQNIENISIDEINQNENLSKKERNNLLFYKSMKSKKLNTEGTILGSKHISDLDLSDQMTSEHISDLLSGISLKYNEEKKSATTSGAENINEFLKNSSDLFGNDPSRMLELLSKDKTVDKSKVESTYKKLKEVVGTEFGNDLNNLFGLEGMGNFGGAMYSDAKQILASYLLWKSNLDLYGNKVGPAFFYSLRPHDERAKLHFILNPNIGEEVYYANGGVVAATKGGRRVTVGEAGHDEIIIPTDPAKQQRAQELLTLAQDKYGLYAKNPDNIDAKLKQQMSDLLLDLRILMIQLNPMSDVIAMQKVMQAFGILKNASVIANPDSETDVEELIGEGMPTLGEPIKDAANLGAIRNKIVEEAKKYIGTRYAEAPAGLVCNQLVNAAYAGVLGKENYAEMLRTLGYAHDEMHTISGFIPEIRRGSGDKVLLASSVEYSALSSLAKPGDLVFSANTGKVKNGLNPDNHGHVNLFIDKDSKIDSTSVNNAGVGIHKPGKGAHMLMNLLDNMPESWYVSKGLLKSNAVGIEDTSTMSSHYVYDPSLQSTPNASYVSDQVSRADKAKIEKERRMAEKQNKNALEQMKEIVNNFGIKLTGIDGKRKMSISVPEDKAFCTSGMNSSSGLCYSIG